MDTDSVTDTKSLPCVLGITEEGELSDIEQDLSFTDADQALSSEQNYRETMRGIRLYMGWSHIPDVDAALSSTEDNPFADPKQQPTSKISVNLPTDNWLCRKMERLNVTLAHGYPSRGSDAGGRLIHNPHIRLKIRHNAHFSLKYLEMLKTGLHSTRAKRKRCYDVRLSRQEGSTRRHLRSAQY